MDLLYQRYASPFSFMNGMLQTGRFCEFVEQFAETVVKEKETKTRWEYYLHKVWDEKMSFQAFEEQLETNKQNATMSKRTIETTVQDSMDILKHFNPNEGGE